MQNKFTIKNKLELKSNYGGNAMFVNFTNHPSSQWSSAQLDSAKKYGSIVDLPFPNIEPQASDEELDLLFKKYIKIITDYSPTAVMVQGEFVFTMLVVSKLIKMGITVLAATSERKVTQEVVGGKTQKQVSYEFVKFRKYRIED